MERLNKKEILTGKEWEVVNTFVQPGGKWLIRAINKASKEEVEFNITSSYLNKIYREGK